MVSSDFSGVFDNPDDFPVDDRPPFNPDLFDPHAVPNDVVLTSYSEADEVPIEVDPRDALSIAIDHHVTWEANMFPVPSSANELFESSSLSGINGMLAQYGIQTDPRIPPAPMTPISYVPAPMAAEDMMPDIVVGGSSDSNPPTEVSGMLRSFARFFGRESA